ncbi:hypothetical protein DFS33DRAFT_1383554 [Desarmillaria ectypa]|nr:hypothetical protein DFS33DRAFT_1383554 [Desarmillaria ectypa]
MAIPISRWCGHRSRARLVALPSSLVTDAWAGAGFDLWQANNNLTPEALADFPSLSAFVQAVPRPVSMHALIGVFRCISCHEPLHVDTVLACCSDDDERREFSKIWSLECGHLLDSACVSAYLCHLKRLVRILIPPSKWLGIVLTLSIYPPLRRCFFFCLAPFCDATFRTIQVGTADKPRWTFGRDVYAPPYDHHWYDSQGYAMLEDLECAGVGFDVTFSGWENPMRWRF